MSPDFEVFQFHSPVDVFSTKAFQDCLLSCAGKDFSATYTITVEKQLEKDVSGSWFGRFHVEMRTAHEEYALNHHWLTVTIQSQTENELPKIIVRDTNLEPSKLGGLRLDEFLKQKYGEALEAAEQELASLHLIEKTVKELEWFERGLNEIKTKIEDAAKAFATGDFETALNTARQAISLGRDLKEFSGKELGRVKASLAVVQGETVKPLEITGEQFELVESFMLVYANSRKDWLESRGGALFKDASSLSKEQQAEALFEALKKNGLLGIVYSPSKERMPKTAEQVLTKEADGKYHADCDEFAYAYAAVAKRLGIEGVGGIAVSYKEFGKEELRFHVCILKFEETVWVLDQAYGKLAKIRVANASPEILEKDKKFQNALVEFWNAERRKAGQPEIISLSSFRILKNEGQLEALYYVERGVHCMIRHTIDEAMVNFEKAVKQDNANPLAQVKLGQIYYEKEKYNEAIAHFIIGLENYSDPYGYLMLGDSYAKIGDLDDAEYALINALRIDSRLPEAYQSLGVVAYMKGDYMTAIQHYENAKKYYKQFLIKQKKDTSEYEETFKNTAEVYYGQAVAYVKLEDYKKARDILREAIEMGLHTVRPDIKKLSDDLKK